jgi:Anion-transporting ATPase
MDIAALCADSSVVIRAGKGGVGKTTVSLAVARLAARNGISVLLVELEGKSGLNAAFGHHLWTRDLVELVRARALSADDALVEYLIEHGWRWAARRLASLGILDVVATAIPGVRDVLVLGRIAQLERSGIANLIVVDGPAAGHATTFPTSAKGILDASRAGPVRALAAEVVELLSDPARCHGGAIGSLLRCDASVAGALSPPHRVGCHKPARRGRSSALAHWRRATAVQHATENVLA